MSTVSTARNRLLALCIGMICGAALAAPSVPGLNLKPWAEQTPGVTGLGFVPAGTGADRLLASEREGLLLVDEQGRQLARFKGSFNGLDSRAAGGQLLVASLDNQRPVSYTHLTLPTNREV